MSRAENFSVIQSCQEYINKMIGIPGMKALILDDETTSIIAMVMSQTDIISKEVYLTERIDNLGNTGNYQHLKAIVFIRPTPSNITHIRALLATNKYKEYHMFFSNVTGEDYLRQLAESDAQQQIRTVNEYFADFYALTDSLFTFHIKHPLQLSKPQPQWSVNEKVAFQRTVQGLASVFASFKKKPEIRYSGSSDLCRNLGNELSRFMGDQRDLFNHPQNEAPLLLLFDRRDDPVTPLLLQWTYQAMVNELLGIHDNRVDLREVPGVDKSIKEVVLSSKDDKFFRDSMHLNFGDLGASIKSLVVDYQRKTKSTVKLDTIEDMQAFVDKFPEFRAISGNVNKHVTLMHALSGLVAQRRLMRVSELEQDLACSQDHGKASRELYSLIEDPSIRFDDKLRSVMLYALRYERDNNQLGSLTGVLKGKARNDDEIRRCQAIQAVLGYAGFSQRGGDLFGNKNVLSKMISSAKSSVKGVDNIYTQHKPVLADVLTQLSQQKLHPKAFPFVDASGSRQGGRYSRVVVFIVGGATFEETAAVDAFNFNNQMGMKAIVGGSLMLNSQSFIEELLTGAPEPQETYSNGFQ